MVLPYYLHNFTVFAKITILGEFLAIAAVTMCMLFIFVDMGQPARVLNVLLYPMFHSMMFWDLVSLTAERNGTAPARWVKPVILVSIPWAVSIYNVTAFLYAGLPGRPLWMTAVLAPRFLASAFASGPARLILLCLLIARVTKTQLPRESIQKIAVIVTYAMVANVFLILMEFFTAHYSAVPEHRQPFQYMFTGIEGHARLAPWMWTSVILASVSLVLLIVPRYRTNPRLLPVACAIVFLSLWIDKGIGLIVAGFVPSPLGVVPDYVPALPEMLIVAGIWGVGMLMLTVFYKIVIAIRSEPLAGHA